MVAKQYRYTSTEKEILCNLDVHNNPNAKKWQNRLAGKLAEQIENDVENTLYNPEKINKYRKQAGLDAVEGQPFLNTENVQTALGWFSSVRLFVVRLNGSLKLFGRGFLPKWFDTFGLSYIVELVVDIVDIVYSTFFAPLREPEKKRIENGEASLAKIFWWRFKNKITQDDDLIPRMLNAAVWFSINLAIFIVTGGVGAVILSPVVTLLVSNLNIGGFIFDVFNEFYKGIKDFFRHEETLEKVEKELDDLSVKLKDIELLKKDYEVKQTTNCEDYFKLIAKYEKIQEKIESREVLKNKLKKKITWTLIPTRVFNWAVASVISVGMGMFACADKIIMTAGRLAAFIGGSVIGGFGRRVRNFFGPLFVKAKDMLFLSSQAVAEKDKIEDSLNNSTDQTHYTSTLPITISGSDIEVNRTLQAKSHPTESKWRLSFNQETSKPLASSCPINKRNQIESGKMRKSTASIYDNDTNSSSSVPSAPFFLKNSNGVATRGMSSSESNSLELPIDDPRYAISQ